MKRFTLILASLFLSLGALNAQEVYVTNLGDLSNEKTYLIESKRCVLMNYDGYANGLASNNANNCTAKRNFEDNNQLFKIEKDGENYYLYSVGAGKYVTVNGAWSDTKETALVINNVGGDYPWHLCIGNQGINTQIRGQFEQGLVVNNWTQADEGNCFRIVDAEASTVVVIDYPNELTEFNQNKCYTVTTKLRGGWAVDANGRFVSTGEAGTVADEYKQFAVLSADGENYYLYNVGAQAFITTVGADDKKGTTVKGVGEAITLIDASAEGDCRVLVQFKGNGSGYINLNGESNMDVCGWSLVDHGNAVAFIEAGDFNPTEALAMLSNVATVTYIFKYGGVEVARQEEVVNKGGAYPAFNVPNVPLGIVPAEDVPAGTVTADAVYEIELAVNNELIPFKYATTGTPSVWYYARLHGNPGVTSYIEDNGSETIEWSDKNIEASEIDSHLWGFVGDAFNGFKMVNKGTGYAIASTGSGNATMAEVASATAFHAMASDNSTQGAFCLKYKGNANYLNAQDGIIKHWNDNDNGSSFFLTEYSAEEVATVEVSAANYATLFLGEPVYIPAGVEAYVVSGAAEGLAHMEQVTGILPANTGVILKNTGNYTFTLAPARISGVGTNLLAGTLTDTEIAKEEGNSYYILADGDEGIGFYNPVLGEDETKFNNAANKAYLVVPESVAPEVACYSFRFGEGTTGIENVTTENVNVTVIYDLTGRRVEAITAPGIYVVNGKKVLVK